MKRAVWVLLGLLLLVASRSNAQAVPQQAQLPASFTPGLFSDAASDVASDAAGDAVANRSLPQALLSAVLIPPSAQPGMSNPSSRADFPPQGVTAVFPHYSFQAYVGYTFVRVYALPTREVNRNGFDLSMSYYVKNSNIGIEGALSTTFGSIGNQRSDFVFAGGGPRVRWSAPRGTELWAHGLVGGANFGPSIAGFSQSAIGYEVGGDSTSTPTCSTLLSGWKGTWSVLACTARRSTARNSRRASFTNSDLLPGFEALPVLRFYSTPYSSMTWPGRLRTR